MADNVTHIYDVRRRVVEANVDEAPKRSGA